MGENRFFNTPYMEQVQVPMDKIAQAPRLYFYHNIDFAFNA
jgi:hypothetical protein